MSDTPRTDAEIIKVAPYVAAGRVHWFDAVRADLARELERENAELRAALADIEEREAACCPEDVPFDELIPALRELIARLEYKIAKLKDALEAAKGDEQ